MKTRKSLLLLLPLLCLPSCSQTQGIVFSSNVAENVFTTLYDDAYFSLDNATYHSEIALPSYATAMSTICSDRDYSERDGFLLDLWKKEGFTSFYVSDSFKQKPNLDTIGYAFAHKTIALDDGPAHLLAITIRSGTYEGEWASNITLGFEGDAKGMADSASIVYQDLLSYVQAEDYKGKVKFWLSGYSRGGSVANILAGTLLDALEEGNFVNGVTSNCKDVYAYCFEPIACANTETHDVHNARYQGVKNVINFNDPMPHVIPAGWGFARFGEDLYYPDRLTDIRFSYGLRERLLAHYRYEEGGHRHTPYTVDEWKFFDVGPSVAAEENLPRDSLFPSIGRVARILCNNLASTLTRPMYAGIIEPGLRDLIAAFMGLNPAVNESLITPDMLLNVISSYVSVRNLLFELQQGEAGAFFMDMRIFLYEFFGANKENFDAVKDLCDSNYFLFYAIPAIFVTRKDLALQCFYRDNLTKLFQCHYTELNYSFTRSCDKRLYGQDACELNDGTYYLLHVEGAKDIVVEDERYGTLFSYQNGTMSGRIAAERLHDGSVDIYLPKNGIYSYRCRSTSLALSDVDASGVAHLLQEGLPQDGRIAD